MLEKLAKLRLHINMMPIFELLEQLDLRFDPTTRLLSRKEKGQCIYGSLVFHVFRYLLTWTNFSKKRFNVLMLSAWYTITIGLIDQSYIYLKMFPNFS